MEHAYREDELLDAVIVDSEGYVYGKVSKVNIDENEIRLQAYEEKPDVKTVVDMGSLKETLLRGVRMSFGSRLRRIASIDVLANSVRKELGLKLDDELVDDHYVKYAERVNIPIPYVKAALERKEQKGTINLKEIKSVRITVLGRDKETKVIKVILLHVPREAAFRRIPVQEKLQFRDTNIIRDKLVLDSEGNALGYVDSVVLLEDRPAIRIYITRMHGEVNLSLLTKFLERSGQGNIASLVRRHLIEPEPSRYIVETEELEDFMYQMKVAFTVPEKLVAGHRAKEFVAEIPWNSIHKIGDVILLKSTSTELQSKGYFQRS